MTTVQQLAAAYLDQFESLERDNFSTYKRKDDADDRLQELCYAAHDDMMPDDYKYNFIVDALGMIADADEDADLDDLYTEIEADVYNSNLLHWLSSNLNRADYIYHYIEEFGFPGIKIKHYDQLDTSEFNFFNLISNGQWMEKVEVFNSVLASLIEITTELEDEEDDELDENEE